MLGEGDCNVLRGDAVHGDDVRDLGEVVGDDKDEEESSLALGEGYNNTDGDGLERSLGLEQSENICLFDMAHLVFRALRSYTHIPHDLCGHLRPIIHFSYTIVHIGLPRAARERTVVCEAENTGAMGPWKPDLDEIAVATMPEAQNAVFIFEEDSFVPPRGCTSCLTKFIHALFPEDLRACSGNRRLPASRRLTPLPLSIFIPRERTHGHQEVRLIFPRSRALGWRKSISTIACPCFQELFEVRVMVRA